MRIAQLRLTDHDKMSSQYTTGNYLSITKHAVKNFQRSRDLRVTGTVNRATWRKLAKPVALPHFCRKAEKALCIDKRDRKTRFVVNGNVRLTMDARFGDPRGPEFVTEEGRLRVYWKDRDHVSTIYDAPMPFSLFFNGGQAVHYSPDFNAVGYSGSSHGCVNSRDWGKMRRIFERTPEGTPVLVY